MGLGSKTALDEAVAAFRERELAELPTQLSLFDAGDGEASAPAAGEASAPEKTGSRLDASDIFRDSPHSLLFQSLSAESGWGQSRTPIHML
jgi:hypothetical protein